jgi:hypothetical protein
MSAFKEYGMSDFELPQEYLETIKGREYGMQISFP